jgi:hypothetical protein
VDLDAASRERCRSRQDVGAAAVASDTERQDVWVFGEEQEIANAAGAAVLDKRALHRQRVGVGNQSQAADFDKPHFRFQISEFRLI